MLLLISKTAEITQAKSLFIYLLNEYIYYIYIE